MAPSVKSKAPRAPPPADALKRSSSLTGADLALPLPHIAAATASAAPSVEAVADYLRAHPAFLERYVTGASVSRETFQRWALKRGIAGRLPKEKLQQQSSNGFAGTSDDCARLRRVLGLNSRTSTSSVDVHEALFELASACAQIVQADKFELRLVDETADKGAARWLSVARADDGALRAKPARRFGKKLPLHVLRLACEVDALIGEVHFFTAVGENDAQLLNMLATWACAAVHYGRAARAGAMVPPTPSTVSSPLNEDAEYLRRQRRLNAFLLDVVKSIFQDMNTMDTVIHNVMNFAQKLVDADRASLFLVDTATGELFARIFDITQEVEVAHDPDNNIQINNEGNKEIRFKIGKGIAGYVAQTGHSLNIPDAYEDERFNREIDTKTGYRTKTILCMPIFLRNSVIGVVQMVNKHEGTFTTDDESAFETFANYCGLALHHARLYDKIRRSEQKYRVALEVLAYHSVCNRDEVDRLKKVQLPESLPQLELFEFNGNELSELEKPMYCVRMFNTLFRDVYDYANDDLIRLVLTVRKNYRQVPYHNWTHGWTVAHAMYVFLRRHAADVFTPLESLALFVAALCHDLDHRGKNNAYMKTMSTPLAAIYSTSVMEHHHFNQTVTILQQEGHNIFKSLRSDEYKQAFAIIRRSILATDLALFFPNRVALNEIVASGQFNWDNDRHRQLSQAILMTACDLIATAKPWKVQIETVKVIIEEFYEQGDAEKLNGREPLPMMDRTRAHELPQMQVGFMRGICIPCYELLSAVLPDAQRLCDSAKNNAAKWAELNEEQKSAQNDKRNNEENRAD